MPRTLHNSTLSRKPFREGKPRREKEMNKAGKKAVENARALRVFKRECAKFGIDRCEARVSEHCTGGERLTWAHGRKRRLLLEGELETFAIVCCMNCHRVLDEQMSHEEMAAFVAATIERRPERLAALEAA